MKQPTPERTVERRSQERVTDAKWRTALTCIEPNKILVRGYPLDEIMGRLTFGEAIYLLLMGECPVARHRPADGGDARVVHRPRRDAAVDARGAQHGDDRRAAARLRCRRSARIRPVSRRRHRELHAVSRHRPRAGARRARRTRTRREQIVARCQATGEPVPGFGHRLPHARPARGAAVPDGAGARGRRRAHPDDPRRRDAARRATRRARAAVPVNIDGAIAAVCGDLGMPPDVANALFIISRVPGHRGAGPGRARARSTRCGRSIPRITSTTDRRSAACQSGANSATANVRSATLAGDPENHGLHGRARTNTEGSS